MTAVSLLARPDNAAADMLGQIDALARKWDALRGRQIGHAGGCGCGSPMVQIPVANCEQAIVAFLFERYRGEEGGGALLFGGAGADAALVDVIAALRQPDARDLAPRAIGDLRRTLASLSRQVCRPYSHSTGIPK
ncbi:hypothetical protein [Sphingopyxis kveilinensis]|uniref:hypothetical protein n=1 Tax=Sphingopyxis kveilinensis TaxID=3114367 RepID=UPI0030D46F77